MLLGKSLTLIVLPICLVYKCVMVSCWRKPEKMLVRNCDGRLSSTEFRETDVAPGCGSLALKIRIITISPLDAKWR